ncbi:MAG: FAD-dependent oxidoreductase [Chthoniobacterales bacterium]
MAASLYGRLTRRYQPQPTALDRRAFLKITLAASAGLLLSNGASWARSGTSKKTGRGRRIIVIGGGFAGLACAHELLSAGYEVIVLEARRRVGGRVLSFADIAPGKVVEGGGELIGSNHPTWMAYARHFGLKFNDVTEEKDLSAPIVLGGHRLAESVAKGLWLEMDTAYKAMNRDAAGIHADRPWSSPNARSLDTRSTAQWLRALPISDLCRLTMAAELTSDNGVATARQSYLGNLAQVKGGGLEKYWTESEVYRCRGGNDQLAHKLVTPLGENRLHLGVPAQEVRIAENKVTVRDAAGRLFEGDDVVLAIPPSAWRHVRFEPNLPHALRPQMGTNVKYLARVKDRFWRKSGTSPGAVSDGMVGITWDATENQGHDADGIVLTGFSGGPPAELARHRWKQKKDAAFVSAFQELYPNFPQNFIHGRFMDWPSERWTGAGYSFPAPGQVTTMGPILQQGIGRLHFAGEHACYKFVGYMEGALNSGVAAAHRLAARDAGRQTQPA